VEKKWQFTFEHIFLTLTSVGQIFLAIYYYGQSGNSQLRNLGWVCLWMSAIFGWLPIFAFKKYGRVSKGKSYVHTQTLVDQGVYSIVRHPQYLAGIFISAGLYLIAPYWGNLTLGVINTIQYVYATYQEDQNLIKKFGDDYLNYMKGVPRLNFVRGFIRKEFH